MSWPSRSKVCVDADVGPPWISSASGYVLCGSKPGGVISTASLGMPLSAVNRTVSLPPSARPVTAALSFVSRTGADPLAEAVVTGSDAAPARVTCGAAR